MHFLIRIRARAAALLVFVGLACSGVATAQDGLDELAKHPTWLALLHVPVGAARSEVHSAEFFLAEQAPGEPLAELDAAIAAWSEPWPENPQLHARCRFPARFYWLAQHLSLPGYTMREPRCVGLERWAQFDRLRSASLLLVSGYFGNPASTFGHALLRLNTSDASSSSTLLDLGFNFGALIPPNESMFRYVVQGLSGGYEAGFSDKYFYTQDLVYSRTEFRDMWEYELALTRDQLVLMTLHLYELAGRKFTYYFLTENCAFRLAQVVELASGLNLTSRARAWYAPVELFHRLHDADAAHPGRAFRAIRFVPSSERVLRTAFAALAPPEREIASATLEAPPLDVERMLLSQAPNRRAALLDTLISHAQFRQVAEQPDVSAATRERIASLLRQRLALPPSDASLEAPPPLPSPAKAAPPLSLGLGVGVDGARQGAQLLLRGAAFDYNALDDHGLFGGELVVLDTRLSIESKARVRLDQLDIVRVRKLTDSGVDIAGQNELSWQTVVGLRRFGHLRGDRLRAQVVFGVGTASRIAPRAVIFTLFDGAVLSDPGALALQPRVGILGGSDTWRGSAELAWRRESGMPTWRAVAAAAMRYQWTPRMALRGEATRDTRTRWSLSLNGAW